MKTQYRIPITIFGLFCLMLMDITIADSLVKALYIDGTYIGEATANAALSWPYNYVTLGAEGQDYLYNGYKGKIDEFAIYTGVLSAERITAHYNALNSGYIAQVTNDNPLLYLRFEDPNSANGNPAQNSGSVDVDGTYVNAVSLSAGAVGNAAEFHGTGEGGVGDCVRVPDQTQAFSLEDVTIELWINTTADPNDYPRLFQHNGNWEAPFGYGFMFQPNQVGIIGGGNTSYMDAVLNDGNWHHIVVTYDSIILPPYVNTVMTDNPLAYYRFEDASGANGAVCADSAERAYKNGEYINLNAGTSGIADIALVPGIEGLGQAAELHGADGSGNGTCISIYDGWSETYPDTIARNEDGTPRQTLSIELWMNSGVDTDYPRLMQHNDGGDDGFGVGSADGQLTVMGGNYTWYTGTGNVFDSQWHHIVVTYQPGTEPNDILEEIYIDGIVAGTQVISTGSNLSVPSDFLTLGNDGTKYYVSNAYEGLIDEVAFYDTVLDADRIWNHYFTATGNVKPYNVEVMADGPVLYLKFEDWQTPQDSSSNGYFVEYGASSAVQEAMGIGNAIYLDGSTTSGYAAAWNQTAPYTGANDAVGDQYAFTAGDITFECWFNLHAIQTYGMIWQQIRGDETKAPGISNNGGQFRILNGNGGFWYTGVATPIDDEWHHLVLTYDEGFEGNAYSMKIQFYLDGALRGERTLGTAASPAKLGPELNHLLIGGENDRGSLWNTMTGLVDEFAIYDGILSADRVTAHYAAGVFALQPATCAEAWLKGQGLPGDINKDCRVDLADYAFVAADWFLCNDPALFGTDPDCGPTW